MPDVRYGSNMDQGEYLPGESAQHSGVYQELNVLGTFTGHGVMVTKGERLPPLPRGFTWRHVPRNLPSELSSADALARAAEYRQMAATASTSEVRDALLRVAVRFEELAAPRSP